MVRYRQVGVERQESESQSVIKQLVCDTRQC